MKNLRTPTQEEAGVLIAMLAVIFGSWVRLFMPAMAGFPINDGGMFYAMIQALKANGLRLPAYVQYNGLNIPFAYPPLGFYLGAIISDLARINVLVVLQWLPAIVLSIAIIPFYFLARTILRSSFKAGIATLMYAFTPRVITWQIMGGGLTRGIGQFFLLLVLINVYLLFVKGDRKYLFLSILFSTLVVLSHPEATIQAIGSSLLFFLFKGRNKAGIRNAVLVALGTILLSAGWWATILVRVGPGPLLSASQTGFQTVYSFFYPLLFTFTDEPLMTILAAFALIGLITQISKKEFLLPIWYLLPFVVEPRSAPTVATIPLAMLAAITLSDVILPALTEFESRARGLRIANPLQARSTLFFMLFVGFYLLGSTFVFGTQVVGTTLTPANRQAFEWITSNTPANSRFIILTGDSELFCDSTQEWFPALTNRISLTTLQGHEWIKGEHFGETLIGLQNVQSCLSSDSPLDCLKEHLTTSSSGYDYIYITKSAPDKTSCRTYGTVTRGETLIYDLEQSTSYSKAYESGEVVVFMRKP